MTPLTADTFDRPWLLLCEGVGDERFLNALIQDRGLGPDFMVRPPRYMGKYCGGRSCFGSYLNEISTNEDFLTKVRGVLVVSDNDTATSFEEVGDELRKAKRFGVPATVQTIAQSQGGLPRVAVLMVPMQGTGNLEKLCLAAAYSKWPIEADLDVFVAKTPAAGWLEGKQAKMRMQTILAAHNDSQPDCGFAGSWNQPVQFQIPVNHPSFNDIATFLAGVPALFP
jgi:hypothetical protein